MSDTPEEQEQHRNAMRRVEELSRMPEGEDRTKAIREVLENDPIYARQIRESKYDEQKAIINGMLGEARLLYQTKDTAKADHAAAKWLIALRNIKTDFDNHIYVYEPHDGYYKAEGEALLKADLVAAFGTLMNRTRVGEILAKVQALSYADRDVLAKTTPPHFIPLENGIYDLSTGALLAHSPEYFFTYKHPIVFQPDASCPLVMKFLDEIVTNGQDKEVLLDMAASCLHRTRVTPHFYILSGGGRNGKSLWLDIIKVMLGKRRVVSITPQSLAEDVFAPYQLFDKHANIGADIPGGVLRDTAIVKTATGGDPISVQRKGVDREEKEVYVEFIWASNDPPRITEDTRAIWERIKVIKFPYTFVKNPTQAHEKQAIPDLLGQLTTPEEISGLFNECIKRLPILLQTHQLSVPHDWEATRREYRVLSDTPAVFIEECCEEVDYEAFDGHNASTGYLTADEAYRAYKTWCKNTGKVPVSSNRFGRNVESLGFERGRDNQQRSYRGLRLRNESNVFPLFSNVLSGSTSQNKGKSILPVIPQAENGSPHPSGSNDSNVFSSRDLLEHLKFTKVMPYDLIQSLLPGEPIDQWLRELAEQGLIFENPAGTWRLRE